MKNLNLNLNLLLLCFSILPLQLFSQGKFSKDEQEKLSRAEYLFEENNFISALPLYLDFEKKYKSEIFFKYKIGICYLNKPDEVEKAIPYLEQCHSLEPSLKDVSLYLGLAYLKDYKFDMALELFNQYVKQKPSADMIALVNRYISNAENGKTIVSNQVKSLVENIGDPINTEHSEYVPLISTDGSVLIFTYRGNRSKGGLQNKSFKSDPDGIYYEDIFISYRLGEEWLTPEGIGDNINSNQHDAAIALSADGQKMFIYKSSAKIKGDIYISYLKGDEWSVPEPMGENINSKSWEGSCSLSSDENILYFSSERPGGFGGRDIYRSHKMPNGEWGKAENLGPAINTKLNDDAPFIHPDGITLFFSSQGHTSIGGYDIFSSVLLNEKWSVPENLGYPINTTGDDIYYVITASGEKGFYSSSKANGKGLQDIYSVTPAFPGVKPVLALVLGAITADGEPVEAKIFVTDVEKGELISEFNSNAVSGKYILALTPGKNYKLAFEVEGYEQQIEYIDIKSLDTYVQVAKDLHFYKDESEKLSSAIQPEPIQNMIRQELEKVKQDNTKENYEAKVYNQILKEHGDEKVEDVNFYITLPPETSQKQLNNVNSIASVEKTVSPEGVQVLKAGPYKTFLEAEIARHQLKKADESFSKTIVTVNDKGNEKTVKEFYPEMYTKTYDKPLTADVDFQEQKTGGDNAVKVNNKTNELISDNANYKNLVVDLGNVSMEGLSFKLELGSFENPDDFTLQHLEKYGKIEKKLYDDGKTRYSMGPFTTLAEAEEFRQMIVKKEPQTSDAFVTVFYFGQRKKVEEFFNQPCDPVIAFEFLKEFIGKDLNDEKIYNEFIKKCGKYTCDGLVFRVQIGAYRHPKNFKYKNLDEFGSADITDYPDGITRFTMKEFNSISDAEIFRKKVIKKGTKDAFITAFHNGERKLLDEVILNNFFLRREL
ncbi:MAG: PD40 domain-containing protein [Bacteroidetes bacterium]|nr:PD40 domain-containing protein [Bacteroidota bacterium]HET6244153.1 hypothetical protein [Bacteroidia bacterium]